MSPDDGKVALRNFLEILANMAKEQTVRKWQIVKKQIEGLIAGTVTPEAYSARMHKEIINNPQPTLVPFTARYLPHLQAALKSGELEIDLVHFTKREKPKKESESNPDWKVGDRCRVSNNMPECQAEILDIPDTKYALVQFIPDGDEELVKLDDVKKFKYPQWKEGDKCWAFHGHKKLACDATIEKLDGEVAMVQFVVDGGYSRIPLKDIKRPWKKGVKCLAKRTMNEYEAVIQDISSDDEGNRLARIKFTGSGGEVVLGLESLDKLKPSRDEEEEGLNETEAERQVSREGSEEKPETSSSAMGPSRTESSSRSGTVPKKKTDRSTSTSAEKYAFVWDSEANSDWDKAVEAKEKKEASQKEAMDRKYGAKEDDSRSYATITFKVKQFSNIMKSSVVSPTVTVRHLPWNIMIMPKPAKEKPRTEENRSLGFYIQCNKESKKKCWSCQARAELRILSQVDGKEDFVREISHRFDSKQYDWGFSNYMRWSDVADPERGLIKDDCVTFEVRLRAEEPIGVYAFDCPKEYVAAEGVVSTEHAFLMSSGFTKEEYGCLDIRHGDLNFSNILAMFHVNDFWVDAKNTAGKKGLNMGQLGLRIGTKVVFHAVRLGREEQNSEVQYLATAVWKSDLEEFRDPGKRPKPKRQDDICKHLIGVFDMMTGINIRYMTSQLKGKEKREYRKALRMLKSKEDENPSKEQCDIEDDSNITWEERRQLSLDIHNLPSEKLNDVIEIIQSHEATDADVDELEIDFEKLKPSTLRALQRLVAPFQRKRPQNKKKKYVEGAAAQNMKQKILKPKMAETNSKEDSNITWEERWQLSQDINNVPRDKMKGVIEILESHEAAFPTDPAENEVVEVDFVTLKPSTVRALQKFVVPFQDRKPRNKKDRVLNDLVTDHGVEGAAAKSMKHKILRPKTESKSAEGASAKDAKPKQKLLKPQSEAKGPFRNIFKDPPNASDAAAPFTLGEDKDWPKMKKILDELKRQVDEAEAATEESMDKCGFCFAEDFDLLRCGRCKVQTYCSEKCARQNRRIHEQECREAQRESDWNRALVAIRARIPPVDLWGERGNTKK